jgi:hypothetical protein
MTLALDAGPLMKVQLRPGQEDVSGHHRESYDSSTMQQVFIDKRDIARAIQMVVGAEITCSYISSALRSSQRLVTEAATEGPVAGSLGRWHALSAAANDDAAFCE